MAILQYSDSIPSILYKYRTWNNENKKMLSNHELYFASAEEFNDPFDVSFPIQYKEELNDENILKKLIQIYRKNFPNDSLDELNKKVNTRISSVNFKSERFWLETKYKTKIILNDIFGVCCLASQPDNLLMWSHYAESHKGYCIGFDKYSLRLGIEFALEPIIYSNEFPKLSLFGDGSEMQQFITTKSKHWEYEKEFRLIKHKSKEIRQLPINAFKEIIFGCRIDIKTKQEIIQIATSIFPNIKLFDATIDEREFKLNIVAIN